LNAKISRNIIANGIGRISSLLSNIIFVPLYIRLMGGESYGLVVAYATLIGSLQVLDAGWSNLLSRQLALRVYDPEGQFNGSLPNLARTVETISWVTGIVIGASLILLAPLIADTWLITKILPRNETIGALRLIGAIVAIQWPSMAYQGAIMGLQEQVHLNVIRISTSITQAVGAAWLLWKVSPTAHSYFLWVLLVQTLNTLWMRRLMWAKVVAAKNVRPRFDWREVLNSWHFALGVAGIALLSSILTQADKIVLSKTVPLAEFGIYGVAFTVSSVLNVISGPILQAVLPRLTQLSNDADDSRLRRTYLHSCELVALIVVPAWVILSFDSRELMLLWIGAGSKAEMAAILLPVLALGSLMNAVVTLPYGLQIATGWTSLSVLKNVVTVVVFFPALLWAVSKFGTVGAAAIWAAINGGYLLFEIPIMHRRVLKGAMLIWYVHAFIVPVTVGIVVGWLSRYVVPAASGSRLNMLLFLSLSFGATMLALAAILPAIRHDICKKLGHRVLARG
jgi:O-antigen/teichoic acid export membrane protein